MPRHRHKHTPIQTVTKGQAQTDAQTEIYFHFSKHLLDIMLQWMESLMQYETLEVADMRQDCEISLHISVYKDLEYYITEDMA